MNPLKSLQLSSVCFKIHYNSGGVSCLKPFSSGSSSCLGKPGEKLSWRCTDITSVCYLFNNISNVGGEKKHCWIGWCIIYWHKIHSLNWTKPVPLGKCWKSGSPLDFYVCNKLFSSPLNPHGCECVSLNSHDSCFHLFVTFRWSKLDYSMIFMHSLWWAGKMLNITWLASMLNEIGKRKTNVMLHSQRLLMSVCM